MVPLEPLFKVPEGVVVGVAVPEVFELLPLIAGGMLAAEAPVVFTFAVLPGMVFMAAGPGMT